MPYLFLYAILYIKSPKQEIEGDSAKVNMNFQGKYASKILFGSIYTLAFLLP